MLPEFINLRRRARGMGVDLFPVVTENTVKRARLKDPDTKLKVGDGQEAFTAAAVEALKQGGIAVWNPQGERQPKLGEPKGHKVAAFIRNAERHGVSAFAVMFMGFELPGVGDYSGVSKFNFGRQYKVNVSATMTTGEILGCVGNDIRKVDGFVYQQLAQASPPAYR